MKLLRWFLLALAFNLVFILVACNSPNSQEYGGESLEIAVVGNPPKINETKIVFNEIDISNIDGNLDGYDAVFIMKDFLEEAAEEKYAEVYQTSPIPFFFIETEKSYLPFVDEDLTYEGALSTKSKSYATGVIYEGEKITYWEYGLYNDQKNEKNIKDAYSRIFTTIDELK